MSTTIADLEILVTGNTSDADSKLENTNQKMDATIIKTGLVGTAMLGISKQGIDFFGGAILSAVDFESALTDAFIALGDFEGGIDGLQAMIMDLGEALPFSATEVANLVEELGKLGVSAGDIEDVAYSVMALAAGLGTDLVPTGEAVIKIMNSLGLEMDQVGVLTDQLFKVLAAGSLDLTSFMDGWSKIGGIVKTVGMDFVDGAAFLSIFTDAGIEASTAGRVLSKLFSELMNPSQALKDMFNELGIEFWDTTNNKLLPVKDIILNIMDVFKGLSDTEKLDLANLIVGEELGKYLLTFLDQGREKFELFMQKYEDAMSLKDVIAAKMQTARGIWDTFTETLGNVVTVIGQQLLPAFKSIVSGITPFVDGIKNIPAPLLKMGAIVGVLATAFIGLAGAIGIIMAANVLGGFAAALGLMLNPITLIIAALAYFGAKWLMAGDNMETVKDIVMRLVDVFQMFRGMGLDPVQSALRALGVVFPGLYKHVQTAIKIWDKFKDGFNKTISVLKKVAKAVGNFVKDALEMGAVRDILAGLLAGFVAFKAITGIISVFNTVKTAIMGLRVAMLALNTAFLANPFVLIAAAVVALGVTLYLLYQRFESVRNVVDPILGVLQSLASFIGGALVAGFNGLVSVIETVVDWIGQLIGWFMQLESVKNIIDGIVDIFTGLWDAFSSLMSLDFSGFIDGIKTAFSGLGSLILGMMTAIPEMLISMFQNIDWGAIGSALLNGLQSAISFIGDVGSWLVEKGLALIGGILDGIVSGWNAVTTWLGEIGSKALAAVPDMIDSLVEKGKGLISGIKNGAVEGWNLFTTWLGEIPSKVVNFIGEVGQTLVDKGRQLINGIKTGAIEAWNLLTSWFGEIPSKVLNFIGEVGQTLVDKGRQLINGIKTGAVEAWNTISAWFGEIPSKVVDFVGNVANTLMEKGKEIINGLKNGAVAAWNAVSTWFSGIPSKIVDFVGNVASLLLSKGQQIIAGLLQGAVEAAVGLWNFVSEIPATVASKIGDLGKALFEKGKALLQGLWDGATEIWEDFKAWLGGLFGGTDTKVDGVIGPVQEGLEAAGSEYDASGLGQQIVDAVGAAITVADVQSIVSGMNNLLSKAARALPGQGTLTTSAHAIAEEFNKAINNQFETVFTGESLAGAIENLFWKAGDQVGSNLDDDAHKIANAFDTSMNTAFTQTFTGESLAQSIGGWFTKAASIAGAAFTEPAMAISRALDTAINVAMTTGMSGASLALSLQAWIAKAATNMSAGGAALTVGMAIARSLDTGINQAIVTGMSGASLAASITAWIGKATAHLNAGGSALTVGLAIARSLDTATNTGLAALSGESLGAGIVSWVGRGMTTVSTSLVTLGTTFGVLLNAAFVAGIGALSGGSLGAAINTWLTNGFTTAFTSITTFVANSISVLGGFSVGVSTIMSNTMSNLKSQTSSGTAAGKASMIAFVTASMSVMGGWGSGTQTIVSSTMSNFKSTISNGTSTGKQSFITFGNDARSAVSTAMSNIRSSVSSGMSSVVSAIRSGMSSATSAIRSGASSWAGIISGYAGAMRSAGASVGRAAGEGVAAGMLSALGAVRSAASQIISEVDRAMRAKAEIASPSKMTAYFGEMIGQGLVVGMNDMVRDVARAGNSLAEASLVQPSRTVNTNGAAANRMAHSGGGNITYVTVNNDYTVTVDELADLNEAVEFVRELPREHQLIMN